MESINKTDFNILLNEELKRLHDQLTLVAADQNMRNRILDMISTLHLNLTPVFYMPKVDSFE